MAQHRGDHRRSGCGEALQPLRAGPAVAQERRVRIAGDCDARHAQLPRQRGCGQIQLLGVVDQQVVKARVGDADTARPNQRQRVDHQVSLVTCAGLRQHPLVAGVDLGELQLKRRVGIAVALALLGPGEVLLGADELGLQPVDPPYEAPQQECRATAEVVVANRQLVDALSQHRQPVARAQRRQLPHRRDRAAPELHRRQSSRGRRVERLEARGQARLQPGAQRPRPVDGRDQHRDPFGRRPRCRPATGTGPRASGSCPRRPRRRPANAAPGGPRPDAAPPSDRRARRPRSAGQGPRRTPEVGTPRSPSASIGLG